MYLACHRSTLSPRRTFANILRSDTNVVSIPRPLEASMKVRLTKLAQQCTFSHAATLDAIATDASELLVSVQDDAVREFLASDICHLASQMGAVLGRRHLHAQLFVQRSDGCRKFHADDVTVRLLCTYAGPGTVWLKNKDIVRKYLGPANVDIETANRRILRKGAKLQRCEPGEVLLLKGNAHAGNAGRGAAHRSPPLGSSGVARLVLKIDENPCGC